MHVCMYLCMYAYIYIHVCARARACICEIILSKVCISEKLTAPYLLAENICLDLSYHPLKSLYFTKNHPMCTSYVHPRARAYAC